MKHADFVHRAQLPAEGARQSLLQAVLGLILEDEYAEGTPDQTIRNPEAVPLFFHFLRGAAPPVQAWGLDAWYRLLSGSMANLSACQRCGALPCPACLFPPSKWPLESCGVSGWPRASAGACTCPPCLLARRDPSWEHATAGIHECSFSWLQRVC